MNRTTKRAPSPGGGPLAPDELDAELGDSIRVLSLVGLGQLGAVYKALQVRLGRTVAVKLFTPAAGADPSGFREQFVLEARAMAKLNHPNIVRVHDFGETRSGKPYLVMEFVDGMDLGTLIEGGQLTLEHIVSWVPQACEALEYAHNHELIHRDVRPANIMVNMEGMVKINDFRLVGMTSLPGSPSPLPGRVDAMSPAYEAPELRAPGGSVDHRADVYCMGLVLYELLTGRLPIGAWVAPSEVREDRDARFDRIVARALQLEPSERYSRIADLGRAVLASVSEPVHRGGARRLVIPGGGGLRRRKLALLPPSGGRPGEILTG